MDFIPSSIYLSVVDAKLRLEMGAEKMLSSILEPLREKYDYILIDTCPSLGTLTINALAAADEVIITVNPQLLAMMGMQDFLKTVMKIKRRINSDLEIAGILLTMCELRTKLCKVLTEEVTEIPAIVKSDLTEKEAYVYVIETNVIQRGFAELLPSEKATVLAERYEKVISQGKRNDILQEIARLNGSERKRLVDMMSTS